MIDAPRTLGVRLLDAEPDLGIGLTEHELADVRRHAVLPTIELDEGPWEIGMLSRAHGVSGDVHGFLVLDGVLTLEVGLGDRSCMRLVAPGDIVLLDGLESDSIPTAWSWSALVPARLAVLDERLLVFGRRWPALLSALLTRAAAQTRQAQFQQAISHLARTEDRLVAVFWSLGDRLGIARSDGVWVPLNLTHDALARMIGARRPTVSLALSALAEQGLLTRHPDGWLVNRRSLARFAVPAPGRRATGPEFVP